MLAKLHFYSISTTMAALKISVRAASFSPYDRNDLWLGSRARIGPRVDWCYCDDPNAMIAALAPPPRIDPGAGRARCSVHGIGALSHRKKNY